jgi:hypothetical protein
MTSCELASNGRNQIIQILKNFEKFSDQAAASSLDVHRELALRISKTC